MFVVVTYDVNTQNTAGQRRLRKVSKECLKYGQRVQNSVYECNITQVQYVQMKHSLSKLIDKSKDSLRFYKIKIFFLL